jgi:ubiquinone/menaquinone biosynthesis C-methylase UbiE
MDDMKYQLEYWRKWIKEPKRFVIAEHHWKMIAAQLGNNFGEWVLEIGCGPAGMIMFIDAKTRIGLDPLMLEYQKMFGIERFNGNLHYYKGSGDDLAFVDNKFDTVFCFTVIEHLDNYEDVLDEMIRVVKPGGSIYLSTNVYAGYWHFAKHLSHLLHISSPAEKSFYSEKQLEIMFHRKSLKIDQKYRGVYDVERVINPHSPPWGTAIEIMNRDGVLESIKYLISRITGGRAYKGDVLWKLIKRAYPSSTKPSR